MISQLRSWVYTRDARLGHSTPCPYMRSVKNLWKENVGGKIEKYTFSLCVLCVCFLACSMLEGI